MTIPRIDFFNFLFNGGRGVRTNQLAGAFIESLVEDEATGVVTLTATLADGSQAIHRLDGSLLINAAPDANPQPTANETNFLARRLWYDGVILKRVARTPGHGVLVAWPEYANANYRGASHYVPEDFVVGEHYYNLDAHNFVYRILQNGVARNIGGTPAGFRGPVRDQAAAERLVSGNGQLFEWNDTVYRSANYVADTDTTYYWESVFGDPNPLDKGEAENAESDVQGTVSGRRLAQAVAAHSPFTDVEQDILEDLSRVTFPHPTDDWQIRQSYSTRQFFANQYSTFLSLGWDADNRLRALSGDGHVARLGGHDRGRIYDGEATLRAGLISGVHWLFLRDNTVHGGSNIERAPVNGGDSSVEFEINSIRYFTMFADPDSGTLLGILRRISATEMEVGLLAYDASAGTITAEDTITLTRAHLDAALGADFSPLTDIHRESATGVYQDVAGAILEGDTLYLLLTDITKVDGHTTSVLVGFTLAGTPNNRTLTVLTENAVTELPIADELSSGILPLEADELFLARSTAVYRLSPQTEGSLGDKADTDLGNVDDDLTDAAKQAVRTKLDAAAQADVEAAAALANAAGAAAMGAGDAADAAAVAAAQAADLPLRSNIAPQNIAETAAVGVSQEVARVDHAHALLHDDTLAFDPDTGDLKVNIHDVIQHLQETIRFFTDSIDHPADPGGHSAGQMYRTGPFPTTISRVQAQMDVLFGHPSYAARIYRVDSDRNIEAFLGESSHFVPLSNNPHSYDFTGDDGIGIPIPANSFIVILFHAVGGVLIPLRTGNEASDSPGKSYQDANRDFNMVHSVVYAEVHPSIGDDTASYQGDSDGHIRGNIKIFYDIAYDHGSLLGNEKANKDLQNIGEDLTDAEKLVVRTRIGAAQEGADSEAGSRVAGILDVTDAEAWVETANYTDTTPLVGVDRVARYMGWFDGNLYLADAAGNINTRAVGSPITGMARGNNLFVTVQGMNISSYAAADFAQLGSFLFPVSIYAVAVQQDDPTKFLTLCIGLDGTVVIDEFNVTGAGVNISLAATRHTITVAAMNAALGARYFDATSLYAPANVHGIVDLHVVSASEFWILFAGIPLAHDLTQSFTVMVRAEIPPGGSAFELVADSLVEFPRDNGRSFVRIGEGLVYLGYDGGVARYELKSARAQVYREHQQDRRPRIVDGERVAGTEDGIREMSPADVHSMIDTHGSTNGSSRTEVLIPFRPGSRPNAVLIEATGFVIAGNYTAYATPRYVNDAGGYSLTVDQAHDFSDEPNIVALLASGGGGSVTPESVRTALGLTETEADNLVTELAIVGNTLLVTRNMGSFYELTLPTSGGGGGLTQQQVNASIDAGVADWAEEGNTDLIPADKLTNAPGGVSGESIEVLFDNTALTEVALTAPSASNGGWHSAVDVPLTRALVEADDSNKDVRIKFRYTQNGLIRSVDETMGAEVLRNFTENNSVSGTIYPAGGAHPFVISDGRSNFSSFTACFPRLGFFARGRATTGEDVLRILFNVVNNFTLDISEMRGTVELVPRLGGGSSQSQQSGSGRILRTRTVVAGDTLIAANNFNFDLSGDGQIALGRYALNPTPRSDIFDFVATIRVGGRGGIPIRLSREQFDYVGEYDLQDTWPFGGTGGGSWGNVTEIPCAMLYVNHRSEGVAKTQLKPQRQQIGWSMSDPEPATTILIFFSYNSSGNVDFVEMIVFTDQVVEIEGVHLHYWEDA